MALRGVADGRNGEEVFGGGGVRREGRGGHRGGGLSVSRKSPWRRGCDLYNLAKWWATQSYTRSLVIPTVAPSLSFAHALTLITLLCLSACVLGNLFDVRIFFLTQFIATYEWCIRQCQTKCHTNMSFIISHYDTVCTSFVFPST